MRVSRAGGRCGEAIGGVRSWAAGTSWIRRIGVGRVGRCRGRDFGGQTRAAVLALQGWSGLAVDGVVGDGTWAVSPQAAGATQASAVGRSFVSG